MIIVDCNHLLIYPCRSQQTAHTSHATVHRAYVFFWHLPGRSQVGVCQWRWAASGRVRMRRQKAELRRLQEVTFCPREQGVLGWRTSRCASGWITSPPLGVLNAHAPWKPHLDFALSVSVAPRLTVFLVLLLSRCGCLSLPSRGHAPCCHGPLLGRLLLRVCGELPLVMQDLSFKNHLEHHVFKDNMLTQQRLASTYMLS